MTVADTLKTLLDTEWALSYKPTFCTLDYAHDTDFEKFDVNAVSPQVCINSETTKEYTSVVGVTYRVVHDITILVFVKPSVYNATEIAAMKTIFNEVIAEIDHILAVNRYLVTGIVDVELTGWKIFTQKKEEPIIFQAAQIVKALYYGVKIPCSSWDNQTDCEAHGCTWNVCTETCGDT